MNLTSPKSPKRNESCPCGSGRKYKRCCGKTASEPATVEREESPNSTESPEEPKKGLFGFSRGQRKALKKMGSDAMMSQALQSQSSGMDQGYFQKLNESLKRLPKGQMQRFQALMRQAMMGKDVSRELEEVMRTLPRDVQELLQNAPSSEQLGISEPSSSEETPDSMSVQDAKGIVEKALKEGKITEEKARELLQAQPDPQNKEGKGLLKRLFGKNK